MPYKDKKELYAAQKRYRQRVKAKTDSLIAEWTTLKETKEREVRLLEKVMSLETENASLRSVLEGTQLRLEILVRRDDGKTRC